MRNFLFLVATTRKEFAISRPSLLAKISGYANSNEKLIESGFCASILTLWLASADASKFTSEKPSSVIIETGSL